jgi:hypothetical protein
MRSIWLAYRIGFNEEMKSDDLPMKRVQKTINASYPKSAFEAGGGSQFLKGAIDAQTDPCRIGGLFPRL